MPRTAATPFEFRTRLTLPKLTGRRAADLPELVRHLREVTPASVFHHTHHFLVQHHALSPEPPNDFAYWVTNVLKEDRLGEQLAAIDAIRFPTLEQLRAHVVAVIEEHLRGAQSLRVAPGGEEFHFMEALSFVVPTHHRARTLAELVSALRSVGSASIAYHLYEARLRLGADDNDFSRWLADQLADDELAAAVRRLDPYTFTMEGLRRRLLALIEPRLGGGAA